MRPSVVIVGSADPGRVYDPPLRNADRAPAACEAIGRALALARCDLVVFSSSDEYIEKPTVHGFLGALDHGNLGTVVVRTPHDHPVSFGVSDHLEARIRVEPDAGRQWETSFYRSVLAADGVIVVGGGRSTRIAGVLAVAQQTPVVALAAFGGGALDAWRHLNEHRNHASAEDLHLMGRPWQDGSAAGLVHSLLGQMSRRRDEAERTRRAQTRLTQRRMFAGLAASLAILLALAAVWLTFERNNVPTAMGCLLAGPALAAIGGALLRETVADQTDVVWSAARGLGAGVFAAMAYVGAQQLTNADELTVQAMQRLEWFLVPLGFVAGVTLDLVFTRLRRLDAIAETPFARTTTQPPSQREADHTERNAH